MTTDPPKPLDAPKPLNAPKPLAASHLSSLSVRIVVWIILIAIALLSTWVIDRHAIQLEQQGRAKALQKVEHGSSN